MSYLEANDYLRDAWRLAASVMKSGWKPDRLLALWRGGGPVGVAMHEFFKTAGWDVCHAPMMTACYGGIEKPGEVTFTFAEPIVASIRKGERVLIVDDVFDTGRTIAAVTGLLASTGADIRSACIYFKPDKNQTTLKPDYCVHEVTNAWIVFPHEISGLSDEQIAAKDGLLKMLLDEVGGV